MQGIEAVRKLRARNDTASLRIVMYTSQDGEAFGNVARAAVADDVFIKTAERGALDTILRRLDLLPGDAIATPSQAKVVPLPSIRKPVDGNVALEAALEPILDRHREKLRQDLLSEFAILERYEERLRRDMVQRIDAMTRHAITSITRSLDQRQSIRDKRRAARKRLIVRTAAVIAALCIGLALGTLAEQSGSDVSPSRTTDERVATLAD
jgi:CheY-like chemotaxis protein